MNPCIIIAFSFALTGQLMTGNDLNPPAFENASEVITESGYIKLSWEYNHPELDTEAYEFELQQADVKNFETTSTIYKGPDFATFLSGLENGNYYHRVKVVTEEGKESDWSDPVLVKVKHHSRRLAFTLFGLGAIVFFITVGIVVHGSRTTNSNL